MTTDPTPRTTATAPLGPDHIRYALVRQAGWTEDEANDALVAAEAPGRVAALEAALRDVHRMVSLLGHPKAGSVARQVLQTIDTALAAPASTAGVSGEGCETCQGQDETCRECGGIVTPHAPASTAGVSGEVPYPRVPLREGYVWCENCTGQGVLQKVEPTAPAPTPSEPENDR